LFILAPHWAVLTKSIGHLSFLPVPLTFLSR
jgi:hypothetical protein